MLDLVETVWDATVLASSDRGSATIIAFLLNATAFYIPFFLLPNNWPKPQTTFAFAFLVLQIVHSMALQRKSIPSWSFLFFEWLLFYVP
jgi:hypothetical protein